MHFELNNDWNTSINPEPGDLVHLKLVDTWVYKVKVIVNSVSSDSVTGLVDCVFDWDTGGQIGVSKTNELIGQTLQFRPQAIFKLIKERDARS